MKRTCALMVFLLGTCLLAGSVLAQAKPEEPKKTEQQAPKTETMKTHEVTGVVVSTDLAAKTLVIKSDDKDMSFLASEKVVPKLSDLKAGDKAVVYYTEEAGKMTATKVTKSKAVAETKPPKK